MSYNENNLTKLAHLKLLAQKIADKFATKADMTKLSGRVDKLETAGGEANKLEGVKVNGAALAIADKMVDILIATGTKNGTIKVNNADVAVAGLMALAYKAKVSQADLDEALAAVLAAKAEQSDLSALSAKVTTLVGEDASKSVRAISAEEVAKIVAGAPESYDTLKELADWLAAHETDAAGMNSAIQANKKDIASLKTLLGSIPEEAASSNLVDYIAESIAAIGIGNYATTEAMNTALSKRWTKRTARACPPTTTPPPRKASWGNAKDIEPFMDPKFEENIILTKTERLMLSSRPPDPKNARNKNVLIVGGSGSGKTRFWIKPSAPVGAV